MHFCICLICCSCYERLQYGQPSTCQTPAQVTCAHCQRSWGSASAPFPLPRRFLRGEPHMLARFLLPSTLCGAFTSACFGGCGRCPFVLSEPAILARLLLPSTP